MTLEHAQNDACVANYARAAGLDSEAAFFGQRSGTGATLRRLDGLPGPVTGTAAGWSPSTRRPTTRVTEASAWIYLWSVPHDVCGW
jgi:putative alpha-1,2-mannosidase